MAAQVQTIADEHHLTDDASTVPEDERRLSKREDHDSLPDEIKAKYVENLSLLQRMRELHLRLRSLSLDNATCPDSERYPFLKELISLDINCTQTGEAYDHYVAPGPDAVPRDRQKPHRFCRLALPRNAPLQSPKFSDRLPIILFRLI